MPVFSYVGGKQRMVKHIAPLLAARAAAPPDGAYVEPFLGGGSVLEAALRAGAARPGCVRASDCNATVVRVHRALKADDAGLHDEARTRARRAGRSLLVHPVEVACVFWCTQVMQLMADQSEQRYYEVRAWGARVGRPARGRLGIALAATQVRDEFNAHRDAARFIYLNRTCFNGVYRENARGEFNVPWGLGDARRPMAKRVNADDFAAVGALYREFDVRFAACDWEQALAGARRGDVCYCDPPYVKLGAATFTTYVAQDFSAADSLRLLDRLNELAAAGVHAVYSNHDTDVVRARLPPHAWSIQTFGVSRSVSQSATRAKAVEILASTRTRPQGGA